MATDSTKPNWIEPPPKSGGMGCFGKGCLSLIIGGALIFLLFVVGCYLFFSHGVIAQRPAALPVKELSSQALADVQQRITEFKETPAPPSPTPAAPVAPNETPAPTAAPTPERELVLTADEINGLIAANSKSRGHAYVSLGGNTAQVQLSIPSNKIPGFPRGYLNGSFVITTDGPTPLTGLQVSKISANGYPVPSSVLSMSYRGSSILGLALDAAAPYDVSSAEIRNGTVILR
ncbi:MAG: hypothetical protein ACREIF_18920 [Chthoniobacterales bacterium]